ncbi:MAG: hypothetical protein MUE30_09545 [Spirosomaceae bacterium]|nr:hypothetical protein [Spirosomataceae bacterium]
MENLLIKFFNLEKSDHESIKKFLHKQEYGTLIHKKDKGIEEKNEYLDLHEYLTNTKWYLYCYGEESSGEMNHQGIRKNVITFKKGESKDKKWPIEVHTKRNNTDAIYKGVYGFNVTELGRIYLETSGLELYEGDTLKKDERHLRIMIYLGQKQGNLTNIKMALGVYYNVRYHGALLAGSALLLKEDTPKVYQEFSEIKTQLITIRDNLSDKEKVVWDFFEERNLNYIKIPHIDTDRDNYDISALKSKLETLKKEKKEIEIWLKRYDFFISIPLSYNKDNDTFKNNQSVALKLKEALIKNNKVYFAGSKIEEQGPKKEPKEVYHDIDQYNDYQSVIANDTISALERSEVYILIFPSRKDLKNINTIKVSSAITELGIAMGLRKKVIIFHHAHEKENLPANIERLNREGRLLLIQYSNDILNAFNQRQEDIKKLKER